MSFTSILPALGAFATLLVGVAAALAIARSAAVKASLETVIQANEELRKANEDLRAELAVEREKRAALEGKLDAYTTHLADQLVDAVLKTVQASRNPQSRDRKDD